MLDQFREIGEKSQLYTDTAAPRRTPRWGPTADGPSGVRESILRECLPIRGSVIRADMCSACWERACARFGDPIGPVVRIEERLSELQQALPLDPALDCGLPVRHW